MVENRCPICGQPAAWRARFDLPDMVTRQRFTIVECAACRVLRTMPVPANLRPYYETDMGRMMKASPSTLHAWLKQRLMDIEIRRIISRMNPGTFLDVGCGTGDFSALLHRRNIPVVAVDADSQRPLQIQGLADIPYHQMDFEQYLIHGLAPLPRATAILRHVLEHVKDPGALLDRLREYGVCAWYLVVPNAACLERRLLGRYWNLWDPPRHLWHFTAGSLRLLCERLGLEVRAQGYDTIPNLIPSLYRFLRVHGAPPALYEPLTPKGMVSSASAPLNLLLPGNVLWMLATLPPVQR